MRDAIGCANNNWNMKRVNHDCDEVIDDAPCGGIDISGSSHRA